MSHQLLALQRLVAAETVTFTDEQVGVLLAHIGDLNPTIRDATVYALFARGFTENGFSPDQRQTIAHTLTNHHNLFRGIDQPENQQVFLRTFTALITALMLESDGPAPWLSTTVRQRFFTDALTYLPREHDQRGWVSGNGWADGVSHGADLLRAAWAHPAFPIAETPQALAVLSTVLQRQTKPFVFDEEPRLMAPIVAALKAHHLTTDHLASWLTTTNDQLWTGFDFDNHPAMARMHNWISCLHHLYFLLPADHPDQIVIQHLSQQYYRLNGYLD